MTPVFVTAFGVLFLNTGNIGQRCYTQIVSQYHT